MDTQTDDEKILKVIDIFSYLGGSTQALKDCSEGDSCCQPSYVWASPPCNNDEEE